MPSILQIIGANVSAVVTRAPLALIPFGSVEYHGPHAALGTDSYIAQEVAVRVAARLTEIVLCPLISYTACPVSTQKKPGTIAIEAEVMVAYIENVFRSLFANGVGSILALNAHDGNIDTIKRAAQKVYHDFPGNEVLTINWWQTLPNTVLGPLSLFSGDGGHGHGGPLETSAAWAVEPDSVDINKAPDYDISGTRSELLTLSYEGRPADWPGYHGRISECSIEKGETLLQLSVERTVALLLERMQTKSAKN